MLSWSSIMTQFQFPDDFDERKEDTPGSNERGVNNGTMNTRGTQRSTWPTKEANARQGNNKGNT